MEEKHLGLKTSILCAVSGIIGTTIGFIPINQLHWYLNNNFLVPVYGHYYNVPKLLYFLVNGIVLYFYPPFIITVIIIGGTIFGILGAIVGHKRSSHRLWLWAGLSGFLFNFFVSFTM